MLDIQLSANFDNWKHFWIRRNHPRFKQVAQQIFARDHYTCQYCGFQAEHVNFEVINLDDNYQNNSRGNLATACPLCAQCFFIESIGTGSFGGGSVVYLPEMTQVQLNALCNESFVAIQRKAPEAVVAENILRDFKFRTSDVEKIFGDGMSDPAKFGTLILTAKLAQDQLAKILVPLRLLPMRTRFTEFAEAVVRAASESESDESFTETT